MMIRSTLQKLSCLPLSTPRLFLIAPLQSRRFSETKIKVYTKTGDKGMSSLFTGERRAKSDPRFAALGATDELCASLGVCCQHLDRSEPLRLRLEQVQALLLDAGTSIATPAATANPAQLARAAFSPEHTTNLEQWIDEMEESLPPLRNFILPRTYEQGGGLASAQLHVARTVARRTERELAQLRSHEPVDEHVAVFLNRLSDFLFVSARWAAQRAGEPETVYKKPKTAAES